jgi:two-component system chemotaxis sensor kinase CheA
VRNAVDHGIESPAERAGAGKPEHGRLDLATHAEGNTVVIELGDDGRGIDWDAVRARAQEAARPHVTRADLIAAILSDGISTRTEVSETSGRGVGLAALREACEELGRRIEIDSERGHGTRFRFKFDLGRPERITARLCHEAARDAPHTT